MNYGEYVFSASNKHVVKEVDGEYSWNLYGIFSGMSLHFPKKTMQYITIPSAISLSSSGLLIEMRCEDDYIKEIIRKYVKYKTEKEGNPEGFRDEIAKNIANILIEEHEKEIKSDLSIFCSRDGILVMPEFYRVAVISDLHKFVAQIFQVPEDSFGILPTHWY